MKEFCLVLFVACLTIGAAFGFILFVCSLISMIKEIRHNHKPLESHTPGTGHQPKYDNLGDPPYIESNVERDDTK